MKLILQIVLGVSIGIVLGGSLLYLYTGAFAEQLISAVLNQSVGQNKIPAHQFIAVDSSLPATTILPPLKPPTVEPPIAEINPVDTADIAEADDIGLTEKAFKESYKKPEKCLSPNEDHDLLVACGNEHIRARDKFEEAWRQGEF